MSVILGKPFQPSLMFVGKARDYPSQGPRVGSCPTNVRLGWKGLPRINTLAYYKNW